MKFHRLVPFLLAAAAPLSAQSYLIAPAGSTGTYPNSINESGSITGYYLGAAYAHHGFVRDPQGNITTFNLNGSLETYATSISYGGTIAGYYLDTTYVYHGYVRGPAGTTVEFDPAGSAGTIAYGINTSGSIVGYYLDGANGSHGFVRDPEGNITTFDPPGSVETVAYSINAAGAITGWYYNATEAVHSFVRDPEGNITTFDPPGSVSTFAYGIGKSGAITGYYLDAISVAHGFVRHPQGTITAFDPEGSQGTFAYGINPNGTIAGYYLDANSVAHTFVRDPQGNITPLGTSGTRASYAYSINSSGAIAGHYNGAANVTYGFVGRVPNTMDISQNTGTVSDSVWQSSKRAGISNALVKVWGGGSQNSLAESQLAGAQSNGLGTGATVLLNYLEKESAAYQVGQAIQAIGSALTNLKFIVLDVQLCCGEFTSWQASTSYAVNSVIMDPANHIQKVTKAGTSGATAPAWNDTGGATSDGTVVWQDTGKVVENGASRISKISAAVAAIQTYNLPHGAVIYTDAGNWQIVTGSCGSGSTNNCSDLISLPLWDVEGQQFYDGDGLLHCGDGVAGLLPFTPYSSTTWQARSGNQYDWGIVQSAGPVAPSWDEYELGLAPAVERACSGETGLFGLTTSFDLDYFDPTLFQ
jgi:hypothetical protein